MPWLEYDDMRRIIFSVESMAGAWSPTDAPGAVLNSAAAEEEEEGQQHDEESESSAEEAREEQTTRRASQRKKQRVADPVSQQPQQTYVCHQCGTDCKESESGMVGCDECESWYCLQCAGLERLPQEGEVWYCCK
jgi:hypothetical protein